jgi:hypothetical protein
MSPYLGEDSGEQQRAREQLSSERASARAVAAERTLSANSAAPPPARAALTLAGSAQAGDATASIPEAPADPIDPIHFHDDVRTCIGAVGGNRDPTDADRFQVAKWLRWGVPIYVIVRTLRLTAREVCELQGGDVNISDLSLYDEKVRKAWLWKFNGSIPDPYGPDVKPS